ncbi:MAG: hypothetical protein ABI867_21225 [Kofleriaceae bacterium]
MSRHRFRPRYRGIAFASLGIGGALVVVASVVGFLAVPLVSGLLGVAAGAAYLASPTWKLEVIADDAGLEVSSPKRQRFRVAWADIVKVVVSPTTNSCFVDGGEPAKSLLVPGVGAPAPYDLVDRPALVAAILAHVPADRVETVETLEQAIAAARAAAAAAAAAAAKA